MPDEGDGGLNVENKDTGDDLDLGEWLMQMEQLLYWKRKAEERARERGSDSNFSGAAGGPGVAGPGQGVPIPAPEPLPVPNIPVNPLPGTPVGGGGPAAAGGGAGMGYGYTDPNVINQVTQGGVFGNTPGGGFDHLFSGGGWKSGLWDWAKRFGKNWLGDRLGGVGDAFLGDWLAGDPHFDPNAQRMSDIDLEMMEDLRRRMIEAGELYDNTTFGRNVTGEEVQAMIPIGPWQNGELDPWQIAQANMFAEQDFQNMGQSQGLRQLIATLLGGQNPGGIAQNAQIRNQARAYNDEISSGIAGSFSEMGGKNDLLDILFNQTRQHGFGRQG